MQQFVPTLALTTMLLGGLRPEADGTTSYVGPGEDRRVPVPQALDMLRETQDGEQ
ncbi:MAG: hypothetical protein WCZ23_11575 [Rhodospirillaceae bacterium]